MALTGSTWDWRSGGRRDIHVLRAQTSRRLDRMLLLELDPPSPDPTRVSDRPFPPGVTGVTFDPIFNFTLAAHGHTVDRATGAVTVAAALPAGAVNVPNFIIQARIAHTSLSAPFPLVVPIRVHIHQSVTKVWLTPDPLTVRMGASGARFTVLAEFDDGTVGDGTAGDISFHPGLTWAPSAASVAVDANGVLTASSAGQEPTITVTLPADLGGRSKTAKVKTAAAWPVGLVAQLVPGSPGYARRNDVPNVLFIAEGFKTGEKTVFEALVHKIVNEIAIAQTTFPFNVLRPNMNYWSIFLVSRKRGATVSNGLCYESRRADDKRMKALPIPVPLDATGIQSVEHLLFQVGLPLPADRSADYGATKAKWTTLYGAAHLNGLSGPIFNSWRDLADYTTGEQPIERLPIACPRAVDQMECRFGIARRPFGVRPWLASRRTRIVAHGLPARLSAIARQRCQMKGSFVRIRGARRFRRQEGMRTRCGFALRGHEPHEDVDREAHEEHEVFLRCAS